MKGRVILIAVLLLLVAGCVITGCVQQNTQQETQQKAQGTQQEMQQATLTIFNAGSLTIPLQDTNKEFKEHAKSLGYSVDFKLEASGSVRAVRKVTDLGMKPDIVAVADYSLLPQFLYPKYTDFYVLFATNELVLCYTDNSKYSNEISGENWYEILARKDVKYGFSNPNIDPCGYRTVMAMKLAEMKYKKTIFEDLIVKHTNIEADGNRIITPKVVEGDDKAIIRDKSVDLLSLLESNSIDYAFEYKSVALQHGLKFVELPDEINLKSFSLTEWYGQVSITVWEKEGNEFVQKELKAKPIIYGVTVLRDAPSKEIAMKYLSFLLSDKGREVFARNHQDFLEKPVAFGNIPDEIKDLVEVKSVSSSTETKKETKKVELTIVGPNNEVKELTMDDIKSLPAVEGKGGLITSTGVVKGPHTYKGVPLAELLKLVNGLSPECDVKVVAEDGYEMLFTYDQVMGHNFTTYDTQGNEVPPKGDLTPILAYEMNGEPIEKSGPLKIAILSSEGQITEGHFWVKFVKKIEVVPKTKTWTLTLKGAIEEKLTLNDFVSALKYHGANWTDENGQTWTGIPLWLLVGRVDDENKHEDGAFNDELAKKGYKIKLIASDGYTVLLNSTDIIRNNNTILAFELNGAPLPEKYWPLRLVGDIAKKNRIGQVVEIDLLFNES